jgi:hypothetical protein
MLFSIFGLEGGESMRTLKFLLFVVVFLAACAHTAYADPPPPELGVTVQPAQTCTAGCWRLESIDYRDENASGGLHHAFAILRDEQGRHLEGRPWTVAWFPNGNVTVHTKPAPEWSDIALWACYAPLEGERGPYIAYAGTDWQASDVVWGLGLPYCHHVSFYITWRWEPGGEPLPPRLYLPIARSR